MRRRRLARDQDWKLIPTWHRRSKSPQETRKRRGNVLLPEPSKEFPDTFKIAAPGRPDPVSWIYDRNMGQPSVRRKRANLDQNATRSGPTPGSAIRESLINPAGFDKAKRDLRVAR
jgi:hypothetical protein